MRAPTTKIFTLPTLAFALLSVLAGLSSTPVVAQPVPETQIDADIWADNWFALYVNETLVKEDSVAFQTERSFNAESFQFSAALPAQAAVIMKDYFENDTGLEYIGRRGQQMGDGGFIAQFTHAETGALIEASSSDWQCHVIHQAPLNTECERSATPDTTCQSQITAEPDGWMAADFDDSAWTAAVEHDANAVRPKRGYRTINWDTNAKFVWGDDLEIDNVILCRFTLQEG